jgi:hypothetical protein
MEAWGVKGVGAAGAASMGRQQQQDGRTVVRACLKGIEQVLGADALRLMMKLVMAGMARGVVEEGEGRIAKTSKGGRCKGDLHGYEKVS